MVINSMEYRGAGAKVQVHKGGYKSAGTKVLVQVDVQWPAACRGTSWSWAVGR